MSRRRSASLAQAVVGIVAAACSGSQSAAPSAARDAGSSGTTAQPGSGGRAADAGASGGSSGSGGSRQGSAGSRAATGGSRASAGGASGASGGLGAVDAAVPNAGDFCAPLPSPQNAVFVGDAAGLIAAIDAAQANTTIMLADGTYSLRDKILQLRVDHLTLRGKSGDRERVILDGENSQLTGEVIAITASDVTVADLSIAHAYTHAIHVQTNGADTRGTRIYNVHVIDALEQAIKINLEAGGAHFPDDGTIACSQIELTAAGRAQVRNNCYTGGIDAHGARGWTVRDNRIEGFFCAQGLSEHGVHFWTGSRDTLIERNRIRNCARGIGLGLGETTSSSSDAWRSYADNPCGNRTPVGHYGGVVRNNFISANDAALFQSASGFDSGIALEQACDATIVHNSVFATTPPLSSAIEWRFANTSASIQNNLANAPFKDRGAGASAMVGGNLSDAQSAFFVDAAGGDLHLVPNAPAKGQGASIAAGTCDQDIDGEPRSRRDVGADQLP